MKITKPIPDDNLHSFPDEGLTSLMSCYQDLINKSSDELEIRYLEARIEDIYRIMGYRCAFEYIANYSN